MYKDVKIQGWMHFVELEFLYDQMLKQKEGAVVVEIGSWKGRSAHAIASGILDSGTPKKFSCIDTFKGAVTNPKQSERAEVEDVLSEFKKNLKDFDVEVIVGDSAKSSSQFEDGSVDFVFLDANHDYEFAIEDIKSWLPKLKKDALMTGHDYKDGYKGVKRAVDEVLANVETFPDSIWLWRNKQGDIK